MLTIENAQKRCSFSEKKQLLIVFLLLTHPVLCVLGLTITRLFPVLPLRADLSTPSHLEKMAFGYYMTSSYVA
jgi:hypothetical protein